MYPSLIPAGVQVTMTFDEAFKPFLRWTTPPAPLTGSSPPLVAAASLSSSPELDTPFIESRAGTEVNGRRRRNPKPPMRERESTSRMAVMGYRPTGEAEELLARLHREHTNLTRHSPIHADALVVNEKDPADDLVGTTNGELTAQSLYTLFQTLAFHPHIPPHARLLAREHTSSPLPRQLFLDIGSGFGLQVLRCSILCHESVLCSGIEIAIDRCITSQQIANGMGLDRRAMFVAGNACSSEFLEVLRGATHLFAFSAVFHPHTRRYIAENVLAWKDSNWLVYISFDKRRVLEEAGIPVHAVPHSESCRLGGVHEAGQITAVTSIAGERHTGFFYVRCCSSAETHDSAWTSGVSALLRYSKETVQMAKDARTAAEESSGAVTRSRRAPSTISSLYNSESPARKTAAVETENHQQGKEVPVSNAEEDKDWEVERIVGERTRHGQVQYCTKWVGFGARHNTWLSEEQLTNSRELLAEYLSSRKRKATN
jgi:hypothetical protein